MAAREYMIEFRKKMGVDLRTMARQCRVSMTLLSWLETSDKEVTHPLIAERIGKKYKLTGAQIEGLMPENHRKSSPNYNPDKYRVITSNDGFPLPEAEGGRKRS